jgi:very-short-patch-repair endonuclease
VNSAVLDGRRFVATPDLSWPWHRVALEYEGDHHRTDARQWHHDITRYSRLQELGWLVFRATATDYRDPSAIVSRVIRAIESR